MQPVLQLGLQIKLPPLVAPALQLFNAGLPVATHTDLQKPELIVGDTLRAEQEFVAAGGLEIGQRHLVEEPLQRRRGGIRRWFGRGHDDGGRGFDHGQGCAAGRDDRHNRRGCGHRNGDRLQALAQLQRGVAELAEDVRNLFVDGFERYLLLHQAREEMLQGETVKTADHDDGINDQKPFRHR